MSEKAIVFYCKGCGSLFFAAMKSEKTIKNAKKSIIQYLSEGHRIEEVDPDVVKVKLEECKCQGKQLELEGGDK